MTADTGLTLALGVLPELPCHMPAFHEEGSRVDLILRGAEGPLLHAEGSVIDLRVDEELTILVDNGRGGYLITCRITSVYFKGGLNGVALLEVTSVTRRKPHRGETRLPAEGTARLTVITADQLPSGASFTARLLDVSTRGAAFATEQPLQPGDHIHVHLHIESHQASTAARVTNTSHQPFGRTRIGCQFKNPLQIAGLHDPYARPAA